MKKLITVVIIIVISFCVCSQERNAYKLVGGPCEGCEAIFEYGDMVLFPVDTLAGFSDSEKKIKLTGVVYKADGKTPAPDVIVYIYHTNQYGIYKANEEDTGWGKRHGSSRGWIKTGKDGRYTFYTFRPGVYPSRTDPAHIHCVVLEPDGKYYYISDFLFSDDVLLTDNDLKMSSPRGGESGIITLKYSGSILIGERNIVLSKNIPDY